jgi:N,N'-diacetyllegionaminate synthase
MTLIIAEAGVNHNGDMALARRLVHVAAAAGADMVKFQTFTADTLVTETAEMAEYQKENTGVSESQHAMIRRLELSRADHEALIDECERAGIQFFSTGFDAPSIDLLADLGIDLFKVPSGELTNLPLLRHIAAKQRPVILSTGMANADEIGAALEVFLSAGLSRDQLTVLHCTTQYPAPFDAVNLTAMRSIADQFGVAVGYSDHTLGIEVATAAVALGATVIEKHFTLDRTLPGPDHAASLEPDELAAMVRAIRNIEAAMAGDGVKRPSASEQPNIAIARRSIVAARPIAAGEILDAGNLTTKRPGTGISPMQWDAVIGTAAVRDFATDELIEL